MQFEKRLLEECAKHFKIPLAKLLVFQMPAGSRGPGAQDEHRRSRSPGRRSPSRRSKGRPRSHRSCSSSEPAGSIARQAGFDASPWTALEHDRAELLGIQDEMSQNYANKLWWHSQWKALANREEALKQKDLD